MLFLCYLLEKNRFCLCYFFMLYVMEKIGFYVTNLKNSETYQHWFMPLTLLNTSKFGFNLSFFELQHLEDVFSIDFVVGMGGSQKVEKL